MAYYTLHAYDADVWIPSFNGLRQSDDIASDLRYAMEAENVETPRGVLQPMAAPEVLSDSFNDKIETLARFHRRWYTGTGSKDWMIVAAGGKLYYKQSLASGGWTQLAFPTTPSVVTAWQSNVWSWVTYEINPPGSSSSVDVLLLSNPLDGMIMVVPPYTATESNPDWKIEVINTKGKKFGVIERYAERIWGGAIPEDPDMLMYSAPYDPTDWEQNAEIPEDGAGDINQPSWDGDSFTALKAFGSQLIAFKKNRVWRILGTDPGEYAFKEQYGGGTPYPYTIAVEKERILMVENEGLSTYDGLTVSPFSRFSIEKLWKRVNKSAMDQMCAALFQNKYYLALPLDGSSVNNALIIYNTEEGSMLLYTDIYVESLMQTEETLYATSSQLPGKIMIINYDSWEIGLATNRVSKWTTPWMDFGRKSMAKGGYEIYFAPEVRGAPVTFRFSIESEKKVKSKLVTVQPTTFKAKQKRIRFGGSSRRFRLTIEALTAPVGTVWRFLGGIQMVVETDPD